MPVKRFAVVEGGLVSNIIDAPDGFSLPGAELVEAGAAGIGWAWDGQSFTRPAVPFNAAPAMAASGRARQSRQLQRLAARDPAAAILHLSRKVRQ